MKIEATIMAMGTERVDAFEKVLDFRKKLEEWSATGDYTSKVSDMSEGFMSVENRLKEVETDIVRYVSLVASGNTRIMQLLERKYGVE